ncbi:MAG: PACE efflux transporter [Alphaproteobacteria bacterium]|nr:MAG: PACE efflux transporter [Alphaproteobacteria bacterium]
MRTVSDRIRHALSFEIIGLMLAVPFGALVFNHPMQDIGVITIVSSIVATVWNYLYNWGFDHALQRLTGSVVKSWPVRVGHAVLFELGLVALLMPFVAWYLGIGIIDALVLDVSLAVFYMAYAFVFNLVYDRVFPIPGTAR